MSQDYLPPESTKLPFNFTNAGYEAPNSKSVLFNFATQGSFGTLQAAINVMQPYWYTTHTYPKSCPKYVIGYGPGRVQIIKGRCLYGGIRDLQGIINGIDDGEVGRDLPAFIVGMRPFGQSDLSASMRITSPVDLPAEIKTHPPGDLPATLDGIKFKGSGDLNAFLGTHSPGDIQAYLGAHAPVDLPTTVVGELWHGSGDISAEIDKHPPRDISGSIGAHRYRNLGIILRGWRYGAHVDFPSSIHSWELAPDLTASIDTHYPSNLGSKLRGWAREVPTDLPAYLHGYTANDLQGIIDTHNPGNIRAIIRAWHRNQIGDLPTVIRMWQQEELTGQIGTHPWANLYAKVLPHPPPPLYASIRGWVREMTKDLPAPIHGWQQLEMPAYLGGFQPGNLGIILRAWVYGAQQNMPANIHGWQELDLGMTTKGGHPAGNLGIIMKGIGSGIVDLPAPIHGWQELDLGMTTKGGHSPGNITARIRTFQHEYKNLGVIFHGWQQLDFPSIVSGHLPGDIRGIIRGFASGQGNLGGITHGYSLTDLGVITKGGHYPVRLGAIIKPGGKEYDDFQSIIHGWEWRNFGMTLAGTHDPSDIYAFIQPKERKERDIPASVYGWQAADLRARLNVMFVSDLLASLVAVVPEDLSAYIKARYFGTLWARVHSFDISYLGAYIKRIYKEDLPAKVNPVTDTFKNLPVKIQIHGEGSSDLSAFAMPFNYSVLGAVLIPKYISNITAYLFPVVPKSIKGIIHGWEERFLQGILTVAKYPWNLTAEIYPYGNYVDFPAHIKPVTAVYQIGNLSVRVHPWEIRGLPAYIYAANAINLSAYLEPHLQAGDLHASIRPKMIRLTTLIKIPTMIARDMSATINYLCFQTGYKDLAGFIYAKFKGDLFATIYGRKPAEYTASLGAKIGYADSYLVEDTYKINVSVLPSSYFVEDIYRLRLRVLSARNILNAYIRPTPRFRNFAAEITGIDIDSYVFTGLFKNREKVIHKTYDGMFETFEIVEMAFKSAVREYYYSASGATTWKANFLDKWMLDVRSILPANLATRLKRRLHRATTVYDFARFASVDEAIKHAIAYVTDWPERNLGATINNRGRYDQLAAVINARYVHSTKGALPATITPLQDVIIVGKPSGVSTIRK